MNIVYSELRAWNIYIAVGAMVWKDRSALKTIFVDRYYVVRKC
jgi:hypothetical protein